MWFIKMPPTYVVTLIFKSQNLKYVALVRSALVFIQKSNLICMMSVIYLYLIEINLIQR